MISVSYSHIRIGWGWHNTNMPSWLNFCFVYFISFPSYFVRTYRLDNALWKCLFFVIWFSESRAIHVDLVENVNFFCCWKTQIKRPYLLIDLNEEYRGNFLNFAQFSLSRFVFCFSPFCSILLSTTSWKKQKMNTESLICFESEWCTPHKSVPYYKLYLFFFLQYCGWVLQRPLERISNVAVGERADIFLFFFFLPFYFIFCYFSKRKTAYNTKESIQTDMR